LFDPATPQFGTPLVTPGFPDHPAGHGCISGAIVRTLEGFFGTDKIAFSAVSNRTRTTRSYDRFSQALKEIINARVWAGIHFRTADVEGAALGKKSPTGSQSTTSSSWTEPHQREGPHRAVPHGRARTSQRAATRADDLTLARLVLSLARCCSTDPPARSARLAERRHATVRHRRPRC
jgi:hypothetical protein